MATQQLPPQDRVLLSNEALERLSSLQEGIDELILSLAENLAKLESAKHPHSNRITIEVPHVSKAAELILNAMRTLVSEKGPSVSDNLKTDIQRSIDTLETNIMHPR